MADVKMTSPWVQAWNRATDSKDQAQAHDVQYTIERAKAEQAARDAALAAAPNVGSQLSPQQAEAALRAMQDKVEAETAAFEASQAARPVDLQGYMKRPSKFRP